MSTLGQCVPLRGPVGPGARLGVVVLALLLLGAAPPAGEQDRVRWLGEMRNIAVLAPSTATAGSPLLVALPDPGRSARYALESWRELAEREGFVVVAVSSHKREVWLPTYDGPGFLRAVVNRVASRHPIDRRRVYLFGAYTGGGFALAVAADQPAYFAAVASFGGGLLPDALVNRGQLERPLPARIFYPKRMPQFDVDVLEQSAQALRLAGAQVEIRRLDVGRDFERRGRKVVDRIWRALDGQALSDAPRFRDHTGGR